MSLVDLQHIQRVKWLEDPTRHPYVRVTQTINGTKYSWKPALPGLQVLGWENPGRSLMPDGRNGCFARAVFFLKSYDPCPDPPAEAVTPAELRAAGLLP